VIEQVADVGLVNERGLGLTLGDARHYLARHTPDLAFQVAHARLARVVADDLQQRLVGEGQFFRAQAILTNLARDEIPLGDLYLLLLGVAVELDDLHAVEQRHGDRVEAVGRGDEQDLRQVVGHVQVVVAELEVLLRVEHFEQRRGGVAAEVAAQLVNLVEHDHRVAALHAAHSLDQAARHGPDVGAAEPANLRLVADAPQRHARELAAHGAGDGRAERGLAHAWRPDETQDSPFALAAHVINPGLALDLASALLAQLAHRQVLQDALLDVFQAVVVLVQHGARVLDIEVIFGGDVPRQADQAAWPCGPARGGPPSPPPRSSRLPGSSCGTPRSRPAANRPRPVNAGWP